MALSEAAGAKQTLKLLKLLKLICGCWRSSNHRKGVPQSPTDLWFRVALKANQRLEVDV